VLITLINHGVYSSSGLWKCGKPLSPPVEKALKTVKLFFNTFPTGSESMSGLPRFPQALLLVFLFLKA